MVFAVKLKNGPSYVLDPRSVPYDALFWFFLVNNKFLSTKICSGLCFYCVGYTNIHYLLLEFLLIQAGVGQVPLGLAEQLLVPQNLDPEYLSCNKNIQIVINNEYIIVAKMYKCL